MLCYTCYSRPGIVYLMHKPYNFLTLFQIFKSLKLHIHVYTTQRYLQWSVGTKMMLPKHSRNAEFIYSVLCPLCDKKASISSWNTRL